MAHAMRAATAATGAVAHIFDAPIPDQLVSGLRSLKSVRGPRVPMPATRAERPFVVQVAPGRVRFAAAASMSRAARTVTDGTALTRVYPHVSLIDALAVAWNETQSASAEAVAWVNATALAHAVSEQNERLAGVMNAMSDLVQQLKSWEARESRVVAQEPASQLHLLSELRRIRNVLEIKRPSSAPAPYAALKPAPAPAAAPAPFSNPRPPPPPAMATRTLMHAAPALPEPEIEAKLAAEEPVLPDGMQLPEPTTIVARVHKTPAQGALGPRSFKRASTPAEAEAPEPAAGPTPYAALFGAARSGTAPRAPANAAALSALRAHAARAAKGGNTRDDEEEVEEESATSVE